MAAPSLLFDSNAFYAEIGISPFGLHQDAEDVTRLLELARYYGCPVYLAQATEDDINRATNPDRRKASKLLMQQRSLLGDVVPTQDFLERAGYQHPLNPNDDVDARVLFTLESNAVDFLVTQDRSLREHARRAGLEDRVFGIRGAIEYLEQLYGNIVEFPFLEELKAYQLDINDPIFDSLRQDYGSPFDDWLKKVRSQHRDTLVIRTHQYGALEALTILKPEPDQPYGITGEVLKVCTFKVADHAGGAKRGELLLRSVISYAKARNFDAAYVEVFPKHHNLIQFLEQFGFQDAGQRKQSTGELVLVKSFRPPAATTGIDPLEFHQLYGPPAVLVEEAFIVPIQPQWHDTLFPEARHQLQLTPPSAAGNALRKAYLSRSAIGKITKGATLLFYRSADDRSVTAVGVVDNTFRSSDPAELRRFVGQRTVYTDTQLRDLTDNGQKSVLALTFRHDRVLEQPWPLSQLEQEQVVAAPPQTIQQINDEGAIAWIRQQLAAPR